MNTIILVINLCQVYFCKSKFNIHIKQIIILLVKGPRIIKPFNDMIWNLKNVLSISVIPGYFVDKGKTQYG